MSLNCHFWLPFFLNHRGHHGRDHMVVGCTIICAISVYHHWSCVFEPHSWQHVLQTTICDKVCQRLATGLWFSPGTLVSTINKTDHHDITEILLKMVLNTINLNQNLNHKIWFLSNIQDGHHLPPWAAAFATSSPRPNCDISGPNCPDCNAELKDDNAWNRITR